MLEQIRPDHPCQRRLPLRAFVAPPASSLFTPTSLYPNVLPRYARVPSHRYNHASRKSPSMLLSRQGKKSSILVFGGGSTLGKEVVRQFIDANWRVYTLDFYDASVECGGVNGCALPLEAHVPISLALPAGAPARIQVEIAKQCLESSCAEKFEMVLNATLGFRTAALTDDDLFDSSEYMYRTSVESSLVTAKLASSFMAEGGLLSMIGSVAALPSTHAPSMLGFGAAKASVHQMVRLLAGAVGTDLPARSSVVALVPEVLDTPLHRSMNSGESGATWTPCDAVASKLLEWAQNVERRPPNASLISIETTRDTVKATSEAESEHVFRLIQNSSYVQSAQL